MAQAKIIAKISISTIGANPSQAKADDKEVPVMRLRGIASGLVQKLKDGNILTGLQGQFRATALNGKEAGTEFTSGVAYLPGGIQELVESAVWDGATDEKGKPVFNSVKFALDVSATPANNPIGYSYNAVPLIEATENDPLAELEASLPKLALAAPEKKEEKKEEKANA